MSHQVVENDPLEENEVEIDIDSKTVFDTIDLNFEISPKNRGPSENNDENNTFESSGDYWLLWHGMLPTKVLFRNNMLLLYFSINNANYAKLSQTLIIVLCFMKYNHFTASRLDVLEKMFFYIQYSLRKEFPPFQC